MYASPKSLKKTYIDTKLNNSWWNKLRITWSESIQGKIVSKSNKEKDVTTNAIQSTIKNYTQKTGGSTVITNSWLKTNNEEVSSTKQMALRLVIHF